MHVDVEEIKLIYIGTYCMFKQNDAVWTEWKSCHKLTHLCHYIPLKAQLVLPHEVRLLKLYLPQNGHVWVDTDPQERRVGTAKDGTEGREGKSDCKHHPHSSLRYLQY